MAVKILNMTEEEFLKSTPKKLFKLSDIHVNLNSPQEDKKEEKECFIDQLF